MEKIKKTIAVDFDGVIHSYHHGWQDGTIYGFPVPGVVEALTELSKNFKITIFSTRCFAKTIDGVVQAAQIDQVRAKLEEWGVPFDAIADCEDPKPLAVLFIDDNAHYFKGEWKDNMAPIRGRLQRYLK